MPSYQSVAVDTIFLICWALKENIIGGDCVVLHWASWADYIEYIGLTPHIVRQCGTIPSYSNKLELI